MARISPLLFICAFTLFSKSYTRQCGIKTYYDRIQDDCVACGVYPDGCNAADDVTRANCLRDCKSKFKFLVKWCCLMFHSGVAILKGLFI